MNGNEILNIQIGVLEPDQRVLNPRGPIRDTTDLQNAIRDAGQIENPIWVRPALDDSGLPTQEDRWWIIDGERRWRAARQLGMETVPAIVKNVDDDGARALILAANQHEDLPPIVLNSEDEVIGGLCVLVHQALQAKTTRQVLAAQLGQSPDVVSAYNYLCADVPKVQRKVASGQMGITVYALIKRAPIELKLYVACHKGSISAAWVRKVKKNWASIERELADWEEEPEDTAEELPGPDPRPILDDPGPPDPTFPPSFFLNEALLILQEIEEPLAPTSLFIVDRIQDEIDRLLEVTEAMKS